MPGDRVERHGSAIVVYSAGGKVKMVSEESLTENAYHLGKADQRREDRERLARSDIPRHWQDRVIEVLDGE